MNGTIICAVEDARAADAAVRVSARLSDRLGMRLLIVGVVDGQRPLERNVRSMLDELLTGSGLVGLAEQRVGHGPAVEAVAEIAAEEAADVIVVGARPGQLGRTLRSALARELAAAAPCPVVVAPPEAVANVPRRSVRAASL